MHQTTCDVCQTTTQDTFPARWGSLRLSSEHSVDLCPSCCLVLGQVLLELRKQHGQRTAPFIQQLPVAMLPKR